VGSAVFETFDRDARQVVVLAQEEARLLEHGYIGTEHLLLGVLALDGPMADALGELGVTLQATRDDVEEAVGPGAGPAARRHIPFTPRAKAVLELSLREALRLDETRIGAAHVVLGLLREGKGVACQVLLRLSGDLDRVRTVAELVASEDEAGTPAQQRASLDPADVTAMVAALVEAFGGEVRLTGLRVRRSGDVRATLQRPGRARLSTVTLERTDRGWVVADPSG
jgi:ATP-dependent Clp protease ATP-binding subunit ClpC